ncbi:porin family protein [Cryomorphaceae bacterium 1068]|nr:porin family protein [Cryomorphaceae bacterium 1068]
MKKGLLILILLSTATAVLAQKGYKPKNLGSFDKKKYHFGFMLGFNTADVYIDRKAYTGFKDSLLAVNSRNAPGFNLGIITSVNFTKNISLRFLPTLSFEDRVLEYDFYANADSSTFYEKRIEFTYIDFPVNFKFRTDRLNNIAPYVLVGGRYRLNMQSEKDVKNAIAEEIIVKARRDDFMMEFGGGMDFFLPYFKFGIELKMAVGIPNILVEEDTQFSAPLQGLRSRTFMISFTFEG